MAARQREFRVLSTTAILGYGFPEKSFRAGLRQQAAPDRASTPARPIPARTTSGAGKAFTNRSGVKRDLRFMLTAGVRRGIPVVIGTRRRLAAPGPTSTGARRSSGRSPGKRAVLQDGRSSTPTSRRPASGSTSRKGEIVPLAFVPPLDRGNPG
ncbi:MAG: hypothetical protein MZW92_01575 [Comamonadaceae bacterium]|nr:hypothetical protein [Comamonadaceae bacterium]